MANFEEKSIEEKISILRKADKISNRNWYEGILIKSLILLPLLLFIIGLFFFNQPQNFLEFMAAFIYPVVLISIGVALLFIMENLLS